MIHIEIYEDNAGGWRWRMVANNHEIIADSGESYTTRGHARRAVGFLLGLDLTQIEVVEAPIVA